MTSATSERPGRSPPAPAGEIDQDARRQGQGQPRPPVEIRPTSRPRRAQNTPGHAADEGPVHTTPTNAEVLDPGSFSGFKFQTKMDITAQGMTGPGAGSCSSPRERT